ncbi:MAG: DUF5050 domain-containing protein [Chloroflexota bacterium]
MATQAQSSGASLVTPTEKAQAIGGPRFDWITAFTAVWLICGLYLDGWAHNHGKADSTFFTPWHAILYSGYAASALVLGGAMIINRRRGHSWARALPAGYGAALLGVAIFAFAGLGDMIWHIVFGIEANTDALLSPTHLLLATAGSLIMTGPFYAVWQRRSTQNSLVSLLPMLLSIIAFMSVLTFFTNFAQPLTFPLASKEFSFTSRSNAVTELYVMRADGGGQTRLAFDPKVAYRYPAYSPDGSKITYVVITGDIGEVYVANADDTDVKQLTTNKVNVTHPIWSPDGKQIAFSAGNDDIKSIYVINANGSDQKQLTSGGLSTARPAWSPDGSKIAFSMRVFDHDEIFVMNADGSNVTQITKGSSENWGPNWSADGKHIAFNSQRKNTSEIYTMAPDGTNPVQLTNLPTTYNWGATYSPDGSKIGFVADGGKGTQIFVMNADGSQPTNITQNAALQSGVRLYSWSPDGSKIIYTAQPIDANTSYYLGVDLGVAGPLIQTALFTGLILLMIRRWTLPFGTFILLFTLNAALVSVLNDTYRFIPPALIAGLVADLLYHQLKPSMQRPTMLRVFVFTTPIVFYGLYILTVLITTGVAWTVHMAVGVPVMAGVVGLLLSFLAIPPAKAPEAAV